LCRSQPPSWRCDPRAREKGGPEMQASDYNAAWFSIAFDRGCHWVRRLGFSDLPSRCVFRLSPFSGLLVAIAVALFLRVHCLILPYLWLDEYVTLWSIGGESYSEMLDRSLHWTSSGPLFV